MKVKLGFKVSYHLLAKCSVLGCSLQPQEKGRDTPLPETFHQLLLGKMFPGPLRDIISLADPRSSLGTPTSWMGLK